MCPSEISNTLLFLQPPQSYWGKDFPDSISRTYTRYERKQSGVSHLVRVPLIRLRSPTGRYFRSMEQQYPELVTIRPKLLQEYSRHSIQFGRKPSTKEEGSAADIQKVLGVDNSEFAYGTLFTVNSHIKGRKQRAGYFPPIRQPQPQKPHVTKAAIRNLEDMASQRDLKPAARAPTYSFDLASRDVGPDEKRNAVYRTMLKHHEHAIDSSKDENDGGGIPAWVAMRRATYAKRMDGQGQDLSGQPLGTAGPASYQSVAVRGDPINEGDLQDATANVDNGSESSGDRMPTPTETEFQASSYQENENPSITQYSAGPSTHEASSSEPPSSCNYSEYYSGSCKVMRGGFALGKENVHPKVMSEPFIAFTPLSNRGYMLTSTGHDPKFAHGVEQANSTMIPRSCIKAILGNTAPQALPQGPTMPVKESEEEDDWVDSDGAESEASETGGLRKFYSPYTLFMLCRKCGKRHIPPGSYLSLKERDRCGSYLPDWFPAEDFEFPWEAFTDLNNEIHRLENLERGYTTLPKVWDKVHHEEHPVWKTLGHRGGGWWRCRSGPQAPRAEQNCQECHVKYPPATDRPNTETMESAMWTLEQLRRLVKGHMDRVCQQDKEIALKMIRETMMTLSTFTFPLPKDFRTFNNGTSNLSNEDGDDKEESPKTEEKMILEAMWDHQGPISTLDLSHIPAQSTSIIPADEGAEEEDEEDTGLTMKATSRHSRPTSLVMHRQTSSLGANFFLSIISPLQSPGTPTIQEEVFANPED
ncbi:hypothetical protein BKA64DRAFT_759634 [Cadophora sp. MPI-SDFR-AT-0126]|nr:hypothetical protein BKA64DRAFT_759634 [Leotiomycetes sp. MPI-SDFR-AT-0126]